MSVTSVYSIRSLRLERGLTTGSAQKLVLMILASHIDRGDGSRCWPSLSTLEFETGLSRHTLLNALKDLESAGHIDRKLEKHGGPYASNTYIIHPKFRCGSDSGLVTQPRCRTAPESTETEVQKCTTDMVQECTTTKVQICTKSRCKSAPQKTNERQGERQGERQAPSASIDAPGLSASFFSNLPSELTRGSDEERWVMMAAYNDASRVDLEIDEVHSAWSKFAQWHSSYKTERTAKDAWVNWVGKERAWRR